MTTLRSSILAYLALFLGIYVVPMLIATLLNLRGVAALLVSHGASAVQIGLVIYFMVKRNRRASWAGVVITVSIIVLNNLGACMA